MISTFYTSAPLQGLGLNRYLVEHNEAVRVRVQTEATSALGIARQDADVVESVGRQVLQGVGVLGSGDLVGVEAGEVREIVVLDLILSDHRASVGLSHAASDARWAVVGCGGQTRAGDTVSRNAGADPAEVDSARNCASGGSNRVRLTRHLQRRSQRGRRRESRRTRASRVDCEDTHVVHFALGQVLDCVRRVAGRINLHSALVGRTHRTVEGGCNVPINSVAHNIISSIVARRRERHRQHSIRSRAQEDLRRGITGLVRVQGGRHTGCGISEALVVHGAHSHIHTHASLQTSDDPGERRGHELGDVNAGESGEGARCGVINLVQSDRVSAIIRRRVELHSQRSLCIHRQDHRSRCAGDNERLLGSSRHLWQTVANVVEGEYSGVVVLTVGKGLGSRDLVRSLTHRVSHAIQ
mmetsp:Transcript_44108/g.76891  ORF Transcript_44108/g.76891 Transcript_44108/m.76891 type:complete len:412 (-) Transcript_44108:5902-7137(-)